jgi:NitT/TauT family transport system ATP-binding protein
VVECVQVADATKARQRRIVRVPLQAGERGAEALASAASEVRSALVVDDVSHEFYIDSGAGAESRVHALDRISFSVPQGEFVSFVGPSGCGKTTLLNAIAGLHSPTSGRITLAGAAPKAGRADVAYMFATDCLLPWRRTIDNVSFAMEVRGVPPRERRQKASQLLARVGLKGFEMAYPSQLSRGMRQRAALARTFALDSPILLMDEPFGALDAQTKLILERLLLSLWEEGEQRTTVLFVTHDLQEALVLSDRVLVFSRTPGHVKSDNRVPFTRPRDPVVLQGSSHYHEVFTKLWADLGSELAAEPIEGNGKD